MSLRSVLVLCLVVGVSLNVVVWSKRIDKEHEFYGQFQAWKSQYNKRYANEDEEAFRFDVWLGTKRWIDDSNKKGGTLILSKFADWTEEERKLLTGLDPEVGKHNQRDSSTNHKLVMEFLNKIREEDPSPVPPALDWRNKPNRVSHVKDQGRCSSCWAFATTGVLEGQQARLGMKNLTSLSEQQLVDCLWDDYNCLKGANPAEAIRRIARKGGIQKESSYKYRGVRGSCSFNASEVAMEPKDSLELIGLNETVLTEVVAKFGPVAVYFAVHGNLGDHNHTSIYTDTLCNELDINHAMLLVGYGTELQNRKPVDYWIVKNSWGKNWGDKGYTKIQRGVNLCHIASNPLIPLF